mmetsp:Transcript_28188/g.80850  ORF Transcript_28188/g.80850 Transcript_28188/m.80850 type:complete len:119 (+) Transcript_28188:84-440(+)
MPGSDHIERQAVLHQATMDSGKSNLWNMNSGITLACNKQGGDMDRKPQSHAHQDKRALQIIKPPAAAPYFHKDRGRLLGDSCKLNATPSGKLMPSQPCFMKARMLPCEVPPGSPSTCR